MPLKLEHPIPQQNFMVDAEAYRQSITSTALFPPEPDPFYPESDGKPMSDSTLQFRWIVTIKENLELLFADHPNVFIAGDLLWYPVEGDNKICQAPDTMVVFGRPKGERRSYMQWLEGDIPPQVAFEILSHSNTRREMQAKREFYQQHGVEEYYVYDPMRLRLSGWLSQQGQFVSIVAMNGWVSPRLQIPFALGANDLEIYRPDGQRFLSFVELGKQADLALKRLEQESQRAEQESQRAEQESQRAAVLQAQLSDVVLNLLKSGMAIAQVAAMTGLSVEQVQAIQNL
jgi:Uma2 family endonuclease